MSIQPIELTVTGITEANKRQKLIAAAYALSDRIGLNAGVEAPWLEKAGTHKYISKKWVNDHWEYTYPGGTENKRRINTANRAELITGIEPLAVNANNVYQKTQEAFQEIRSRIQSGLYCTALKNQRIAGLNTHHHFNKGKQARNVQDIIRRTTLLPFVVPIIEKHGILSAIRKDKQGKENYELVGKAKIKGRQYAISVILTEKKKAGEGLLYISVFSLENEKNIMKSLVRANGLDRRFLGFPYTSADKRTPLFDRYFIIPYISAVSIDRNLPDLEVSIQNITEGNRKTKFAKAVRAVSAHLGVPVSIEKKGAGESHAGEPYFYPIQQELSDQWTGYYQEIINKIYAAVIAAFDLPPVQIETMKKALGDSGNLRYRGTVIYNPQTGQPLKIKDFEALTGAIEKFLNRNTANTAKRIVLDSVSIGKLLQRMAKYQSTDAMSRLKLDELKYRGKTFNWIRNDIKNLTNVLGQPLSGAEMARYQVAQDYVANLVTRSNNRIRDEIKDTILNGIIEKRSRGQVSQDLFNRLGGLNRDWKRIADTEIVNTSNLAGILQEVNDAPKGEKVYFKRYELPGCCDKCAKVNGTIALWSNTPLDDEKIIGDPHRVEIAIWEGKPQEKGLVTGTVHPNCRGGWLRWGGQKVDAMTAQIRGKAEKWDAAVKQAREEYREKGTETPNDQTPGYVDRINELYREKLGGNQIMQKANPNHDALGRFTFGPDAGGSGGGGGGSRGIPVPKRQRN